MPSQELINFIKNSKTAGQTNEQIKSILKQAGWQDADIEEGFKATSIPEPDQNPEPAQNFPAQNFPAENRPAQNFPAQNYPSENRPAENYFTKNYPQNYSAQNSPAQNYPDENRPAQNYPAQNYPAKNYSDASYEDKENANFIAPEGKSSKKTAVAIIIILLLLGGGAFAYYKYFYHKTEISENKPVENAEILTDCGSVTPDNPTDEARVKECIESKFKECKPAKMTMSVDLNSSSTEGLVTYYYEIIGPQNNYCSVKSKFLNNLNPDWIDKEMTCEFDNAKSFDIAIQDFIGKCNGPLYDLMTKGMQLHSNPNCALKTDPVKIESLKSEKPSITASGFKGTENQILWTIEDANIATVSSSSGKRVILKPTNTGSTQLIITDNAVDSECFVSVPITIK